jgi:hypothetical protein
MPSRRCTGIRMREQQLNNGQREAGGLARAGLRRAHHITPLQHDRDGLGLNRRGMNIALIGECLQHRRGEAEIFKSGKGGLGISGGLRGVEFDHSVN